MRSAVVLCGGKSSRMGVDKAMLVLNGKPLFCHVLESIAQVVEEIVLSVSFIGQVKESFITDRKAKMVLDEEPGSGPMGGLLSGLKAVRNDYVAVAPVDAPLIKPELYNLLFERAKGHDGAVPRIGPYWEPLVAVYRKRTMISAIESAVARKRLDIRGTYAKLDIVEVERGNIEVFDPQLLSFTNINTKEDLKRLSGIYK
ncbi:MAG: molybdenum cofactor guanylyltransferase [Thermoplasmata archaeon]|nr:MAG: molybdenum cofactor guanylyltransferase [Thermoplasmata archaeon]